MNCSLRGSLAILTLAAVSCGPGASVVEDNAAWVGTITTEGNVTTVINKSGSVWGGAATLVEEASIGVERGEDVYMLGDVEGIAARNDRIYVLDRQVPALRVYDFDGRYIADIGGPGAGPGEFGEPFSVAAAPDGRVFVRDTTQGRINVYREEGDFVADWRLPPTYFSSRPMVVTREGVLYTPAVISDNPGSPYRRSGLRGYKPDGSSTEVIADPVAGFERQRVIVRGRRGGSSSFPIPFSPSPSWELAPSGAMVSGTGDEYRYDVRNPDGTAMVVRRDIEPVPVDPDEADSARRGLRQRLDRARRDGGTMEGADPDAIPSRKPAFEELIVGHDNQIWVRREGAGRYHPHCGGAIEDDPCWRSARIVDVFGADGRFLGELEVPDGMRLFPQPHVSEGVVVARVEDEAGTIMVKRYRLLPPDQR